MSVHACVKFLLRCHQYSLNDDLKYEQTLVIMAIYIFIYERTCTLYVRKCIILYSICKIFQNTNNILNIKFNIATYCTLYPIVPSFGKLYLFSK